MKVWICEKPSQAKDIAMVLGNPRRSNGYIRTEEGAVTWAIGHLLEQVNPDGYDPAYKQWSLDTLPILPRSWKVQPRNDVKEQLKAIEWLLKKADEVVIATDADREGEMIGRELLDHFNYTGPVSRLWLSALDEASIRKALGNIRPGRETEPLYQAALARSHADWLVGMNLTRAATLTLSAGGVLSVGRVQTPALALIVRRDLDIESFKSRKFYEVVAEVSIGQGRLTMRHARPEEDRIFDRHVAEAIAEKVKGAKGPLSIKTERKKQAPPKLFSLSGLQKEANKKWGWSADHTLQVAQALYEKHKATTYPRSDCSYLPEEQKDDATDILQILKGVPCLSGQVSDFPKFRKTVFNTEKVTAHHAIIPTTTAPSIGNMSEDEKKAYLLVARSYLASLSADHEFDQTTVSMNVNGVSFKASGKITIEEGWKSIYSLSADLGNTGFKKVAERANPLPPLENGVSGEIMSSKIEEKETKPPARYTEGTLISDMAAVAKFVDAPAIKSRLKETSGIGTEATRASIIEVLKKRGFIEVKGKSIISSPAGRALIEALPYELSDPGVTALWEDGLHSVEEGGSTCSQFVEGIEANVSQQIQKLRQIEDVRNIQGAGGSKAGGSARHSKKKNPPTPKMKKFAESLAKKKKLRLPAAARTNFDVCKKFLNDNA